MSAVRLGDKSKALLNVEGLSKETVRDIRAAILEILSAPHCDERTKVAALGALSRLATNNISISNATFQGPV